MSTPDEKECIKIAAKYDAAVFTLKLYNACVCGFVAEVFKPTEEQKKAAEEFIRDHAIFGVMQGITGGLF